jgi:hypothetical protein
MNVNQKRTSKPAPVRQPPMDFPNPNVTKSDFVFIAPLRVGYERITNYFANILVSKLL